MGFDNMEVDTNENYLRIKAGESVQFNIVSEEPKKSVSHWINKNKISCTGKGCEHCADGDKPRQSWKVQVLDRKTNTAKEFEFGTQIAVQIKTIAEILRENNQTIHAVDLRIKRVGAGQLDTEYFVNQVPKKAATVETAAPSEDDEVPF